MHKYPQLRKSLVAGIILLFLGIAIAPSINFTVVNASNDNDLVEVTTQACGIKGSPTAESKTYTKARIDGHFSFLDYDAVRWDIGFPPNKYGRKFWIVNLSFGSIPSKGDGYIEITAPGQPNVRYDYPEDFSYLNITFSFSWTANIRFSYDIFTDSYDFFIKGFGYIINIQ